MKMYTVAALGSLLVAGPVLAGGPTTVPAEPVLQPAPIVVAPTGGNWGGPYIGAQIGYGDMDSNGGGLDGDGAIGGLHAGYRWDLGTTVLGAEIDADAADIRLGAGTDSLDSVARLKVMAGYDMGQTLIYATAGAAHAKADVGGASLSDTGWLAGVGLDYAVSDRWVVGGEILTHKFDNFDSSGVDFDATTAKLKVSFRF